ncbi:MULTISPECIES: substrate-binding and VWA domain-containing protein [Streptomyces]|uniref:Substrate-binding and VWA domain-containing protein n=1 Tax=Streptomyces spinosisporus TaxID=2927582 RepID=A0ABS9XVS9_9ACTN|nr:MULTISPECIES: substrate-binding and VWA domain-containing protein [Streptomyces]MCI3246191.1 substrate-binding and VWA domain-containing protein [Streptomyces spinosisporus]WUB39824.1 substrate-binding and VWA domain-containing protein [Streptomyces sp. NBC_00588]
MGRHSLPDQYGAGRSDPRPRARRRTVAIATVLVLTVAGGTAAAARSGLLSFGSSCQDNPVRLKLDAAPDITPALTAAAQRAHDDKITSDGRCLAVTVTARDAYKVADGLAAGRKSDAQLWVPDSDLWIDRITANNSAVDVTPAGTIASTPIGVAMVPTAAKSLGWPQKTYDWLELVGAAMQSDSVKLGAADPARSATGLLALTQLSTAATRIKGGDTQAVAMMKTLAQRTSDSDGQVVDTLPRDSSGTELGNPKRNQALILSEQAAYTYNSSADSAGGLDMFYPKDGSPRLDYPYAMVGELSTDQSRAALRFMNYLRQPEQLRLLQKYGFRTSDDETPQTVVSAAGGSSPQPYEEPALKPAAAAALQEALGTWTITVQSARITTVVDASSSMSETVPGTGQSRMDVTKGALLQALATFTPEDEIGLWKFSTKLDGDKDYRILVPTERLGDQKGGGTQRDRLSAAFGALKPVPNGATGLYDTTLAAYKAAASSYAKGKFNALVILTDGVNQDPGSISRDALITQLQKLTDPERPVPLIMIAVGPDADREEADEIARATGGSGQSVSNPAQIQSVILKAIVAAGSQGDD